MSTLAALIELGAKPRLAPDGRLVVAGLDRLSRDRAARALELARAHKGEVMAELKAEAETVAAPIPSQAKELGQWVCWWCGHPHYFVNLGGQPVCARCHPPADPVRFTIQ